MKYWLMKSEPDVFSIDDLKKKKSESWDGVRNYQARNFMRDEMKKGDIVLFYHSNCKPPGIVGLAEVSKEAHPDESAFDKKSKYYDPKSKRENPTWILVDVKFKKKFKEVISLDDLKADNRLKDMKVVQRGQRLSIQPVTDDEFRIVMEMAGEN